jgi:uncharacterized protein HemX
VEPTNAAAVAAPRGKGLLIAVAAIALVAGLVIGGIIGWQVEKSRVESDVDRLRDKIANLQERSLGAPAQARSDAA